MSKITWLHVNMPRSRKNIVNRGVKPRGRPQTCGHVPLCSQGSQDECPNHSTEHRYHGKKRGKGQTFSRLPEMFSGAKNAPNSFSAWASPRSPLEEFTTLPLTPCQVGGGGRKLTASFFAATWSVYPKKWSNEQDECVEKTFFSAKLQREKQTRYILTTRSSPKQSASTTTA